MLLLDLPKSPSVNARLEALSEAQYSAINMLFMHAFLDPFSNFYDFSLVQQFIDGEAIDIFRGKFVGGSATLIFYKDDGMFISDMRPNIMQIDRFINGDVRADAC